MKANPEIIAASSRQPIEESSSIFDAGPFPHFQQSLGLFRPVGRAIFARATVVVLIGWVPLTLLVIGSALRGQSEVGAFLKDFGLHARSLLAAPLFILFESVCLQRLARISQHFLNAGLVQPEDRPRFQRIVLSCKRLMNSTALEILAFIGAYSIAFFVLRYVSPTTMPAWYGSPSSSSGLSPAAWWYMLVSNPLLLVLIFGWFLRLLLWARFLFLVSRMNLKLISAHPDHGTGLKFLNAGLFAFMPLAFTFGVIAAGAVANRVIYHGATSRQLQETVVGLLIFVLLIFIGPLLVFCNNLHHEKMSGIYRYGKLAAAVGAQFERKWLLNYEEISSEVLEASDFSATTDLYQVVANVYDIAIFPFEIRTLITLCIVTLIPFIPVLLLIVPVETIFKEIVSLLFGSQIT